MKTLATPSLIKYAVLSLALGWCAVACGEEQTNAFHIAPPALVKSVFVSDPKVGKDPFYPNSMRRLEVLEQVAPTNSAPPPPSELFRRLALKGISGTRGQMLALINSSTVGVGELAEIRCGQQIV